jgi:methionyl-tRNA formyltransferase
MRIFLIGNVIFSYYALEKLINLKANVVGVVTKESSSLNADHADLTPLCIKNNIPYKYVKDVNHENNITYIKNLMPDVIYCFGWSNLIKEELLHLAPFGVIGFHPSALPFNRGRHPIIWALALGLKKTSSTFFVMDKNADTGDIVSQKDILISMDDTAATLYQKITKTALTQIEDITYSLQANNLVRVPQNIAIGNSWRKRGKKDGVIDFRMNSLTIYNLVRALTKPYVGAHIEILEGDIIVWEVIVDICTDNNIEPGKVLNVENNHIKVKTADGAVILAKHEFKNLPLPGSYL